MELDLRDSPFAHVVCTAVFAPRVIGSVFDLLQSLQWTENRRFACAFDRAASDEVADLVLEDGGLDRLRQVATGIRAVEHGTPAVAVQRYRAGAQISPHTDAGADEVRVVVNLNQGWSIENGGLWVLAHARDLLPPRRLLAPLSNTGFAFAPAPGTFHAKTQVHRDTSYAIIAAFRRA